MLDPYTVQEPPLTYTSYPEQTQMEDQPLSGQVPHAPAIPPSHPTRPSGRVRKGALLALTLLLAVIFSVGLFAGWQFSRTSTASTRASATTTATAGAVQPAATTNEQTVREAAIAKIRPAVVEVDVTLSGSSALGSGVIVDRRGYIVTNNHVVAGAQSIEVVLSDGTHLPAQLVGTDPADDLAVVKITTTANLTVATLGDSLGDSSKLQVGQDVLAIGSPLGNAQSVTSGIISALGRSVSEGQGSATISNAVQTDAPINPGNSGGALVDLQGNLIGIPTLGAVDPEFNTPADGVGFAIPSNRVGSVVSQIIATGHVTNTAG